MTENASQKNTPSQRVIITTASPPNGNGYGAALAFDLAGRFLGDFSGDARIADPRGLCVDPVSALLYPNSGTDRVLALDANGDVVHDSGPIPGLNAGGAILGPDGRLYIGLRTDRSIAALPPNLAGATGRLVRVLRPNDRVHFRRPRVALDDVACRYPNG